MNMFNESDCFIDDITLRFVQSQGCNFTSHHEAQRHFEKTKLEIRKLIKQSNSQFIEGLSYLKECNQGPVHRYVSGVADKILKHLDSSKKLNKIIETDILNFDRSLLYFSDVINEFYDCGDFRKELCLISVVMALFPFNAQPYVYYGSLLWRQEGKDAADVFYTKIVEALHDPALDYFAADCFIKNGNREKAKKLLLQSQKNELLASEKYSNVKQNIQELIAQC